jgi:hypothetical protein
VSDYLIGNGWDDIDQRFLKWHWPACSVVTYRQDRVECTCGLQATLDAALVPAERLARLREALAQYDAAGMATGAGPRFVEAVRAALSESFPAHDEGCPGNHEGLCPVEQK